MESRSPGGFSSQSTVTHSRQRQEFVVMVCVLGGLCAEAELCLEEASLLWLGDQDRTGVRILEGPRPPGGAGGGGGAGKLNSPERDIVRGITESEQI